MYYFNVVHVFYVMSDSLSWNIFYLILKPIRSYCKSLKIWIQFIKRISIGYLDTTKNSKFERDMKHDQDVET